VLLDGARSVTEGHYLIVFRYIGAVLEIVAVIEDHRDIEALIQDRDDDTGNEP
jgi:hypothetical protein